jgi:hypothetical protein
MQGVFAASVAKLLQLNPIRIVAAVLVTGVVALFAIRAGEVNDLTHIFLCHGCYSVKGREQTARPACQLFSILV